MEYTRVTADEFERLPDLADWRVVLGVLKATFATGSFPAASAFVAEITELAEGMAHHPDIHIRYPGDVEVVTVTHATGSLTTIDIDLARAVSAVATSAGYESRPHVAQSTELAIDTMDADRIRPFWAAVLDYEVATEGSLRDPRRQGWPVWFQTMTEPRTHRNRMHLDISVPHDIAEARIEAALAAGGRLVSDRRARAFWILADADGNEICVCTWQDRS